MITDFELAANANLVALINEAYKTVLTPETVQFGMPGPSTAEVPTRNTEVLVTAVGDAGYSGQMLVSYDRVDMADIPGNRSVVFVKGAHLTVADLIPELEAAYGVSFTGPDADHPHLLESALPVAEGAETSVSFSLHADSRSLVYFGMLELTLTVPAGAISLSDVVVVTDMPEMVLVPPTIDLGEVIDTPDLTGLDYIPLAWTLGFADTFSGLAGDLNGRLPSIGGEVWLAHDRTGIATLAEDLPSLLVNGDGAISIYKPESPRRSSKYPLSVIPQVDGAINIDFQYTPSTNGNGNSMSIYLGKELGLNMSPFGMLIGATASSSYLTRHHYADFADEEAVVTGDTILTDYLGAGPIDIRMQITPGSSMTKLWINEVEQPEFDGGYVYPEIGDPDPFGVTEFLVISVQGSGDGTLDSVSVGKVSGTQVLVSSFQVTSDPIYPADTGTMSITSDSPAAESNLLSVGGEPEISYPAESLNITLGVN